jgi:zinc transport system substrate-binding protein
LTNATELHNVILNSTARKWPMRTKLLKIRVALMVPILFGLSGLPLSVSGQDTKTRVVATLFPLYDFARNIGQNKIDLTMLLPPGVEPHAFEPKPSDIARVAQAEVFIYTGKAMEPWAEKILKGVGNPNLRVVDASKGIALMKMEKSEAEKGRVKGQQTHHHRDDALHGVDPHIWLDFANSQQIVGTIADALALARPADERLLRQNAEAYKEKLRALDDRFMAELSQCPKREFIHAGHYAFGYLARRYQLTYVAAQGFVPDSEPTAKQIAALASQVQSRGLKVVFYEELVEPRVARTVARETGAELLMLHGAHNLSRQEFEKGTSFIDLMQGNLTHLKRGLGCQP